MDLRKELMVSPGEKVDLGRIDPAGTFGFGKDDEILKETAGNSAELAKLQFDLYAEGKRSLLVVLQGMDAAGKDGVINHVLAPLNPQGCRVQSFKTPSALELAHDFLWRVHMVAPKKGEIVIFNRSHYEDVLIQRVHKMVPEEVWRERYEFINDFEKLLVKSGTVIVKFYLHISPEEQLKRFKDRLDDPSRQWKSAVPTMPNASSGRNTGRRSKRRSSAARPRRRRGMSSPPTGNTSGITPFRASWPTR